MGPSMGNFAENLDLSKRVRPPWRLNSWSCMIGIRKSSLKLNFVFIWLYFVFIWLN